MAMTGTHRPSSFVYGNSFIVPDCVFPSLSVGNAFLPYLPTSDHQWYGLAGCALWHYAKLAPNVRFRALWVILTAVVLLGLGSSQDAIQKHMHLGGYEARKQREQIAS